MPPDKNLDIKAEHKDQSHSHNKLSNVKAATTTSADQTKPFLLEDMKTVEKEIAELNHICYPLRSVNADEKNDDLISMKAIIGDATVVGLGEGTHGTAEFFKMKHRLLEFLVVEMGFTIFAMEAYMPECQLINEYVLNGKGQLKDVIKGVHGIWNTQEIFDMVEWIRRHNLTAKMKLQFAGFDMQDPSLSIKIIERNLAQAYFKSDSINLHIAMTEIKTATATAYNSQKPNQDKDESYKKIIKDIALLKAELEKYQKYLESKLGTVEYQWTMQNVHLVEQAVRNWVEPYTGYRDKVMADNFFGFKNKTLVPRLCCGHTMVICINKDVKVLHIIQWGGIWQLV